MNRVLVIESDITTRRQLEEVLARGGFETIAAADAAAAIAVLETAHPPMLVVMNWDVPGADGPGMLRWLRGRPSGSAAWVLMLTGRDHREDEIAALDAGADDFVTKPVDTDMLRAHLRAGARRLAPPRAA